MKWRALIIIEILLVAAGAHVAAAADPYELVTVPPAAVGVGPGRALFRINVGSGQVVATWGSSRTYTPTIDPVPLPAGEYHLHLTLTLDQKGGWNLERIDPKSGRIWMLTGGGNDPFTWYEITASH